MKKTHFEDIYKQRDKKVVSLHIFLCKKIWKYDFFVLILQMLNVLK